MARFSEIAEKYNKSEEIRARLDALEDYDLGFVTNGLNEELIRSGRVYSVEQVYPLRIKFGRCDEKLAAVLELEFRRFCAITMIDEGKPHAPPGAVDMYWHFFILHTKEYVKFCEKVWGSFEGAMEIRHHYPSNDETRRGMLNAYNATREFYVDAFGEPKPFEMPPLPGTKVDPLPARDIWTERSDTSGDSYSGIVEPEVY